MNSGLIYTSRSLTGKEGNGIVEHMKVVETMCSTIDFLTPLKTSKCIGFVNSRLSTNFKTLNLYSEDYQNRLIHMTDWEEVYDNLDVSEFEKYSFLSVIAAPHFPKSNIARYKKRSGMFPCDSGQIKFISTGIHLVNVLAILKAHRMYGIPYHEILFDPLELSADQYHSKFTPVGNHHIYHGYDIPLYDVKRIDSMQYYLENCRSNRLYEENEKSIDFTFGCTIYSDSDREKFLPDIHNIGDSFDVKKLILINENNEDSIRLNREEYLNLISKSKFTFMLPSYDHNCFSIYRFIESLSKDCLPIIHGDCNITDVEVSFDVNLSHLVMRTDINESERLSLLDYYKGKMLSYRVGFNS